MDRLPLNAHYIECRRLHSGQQRLNIVGIRVYIRALGLGLGVSRKKREKYYGKQ
jgi:hypothetical protein